jgi:hypothetical protein
MIIETLRPNDVISIKFNSGEEIIAKLVEEKPTELVVKSPLSLTATPNGMGLTPFMFTVLPDSKYNLKLTGIIAIAKTEKDMASQYIQSTTGLAIAPQHL